MGIGFPRTGIADGCVNKNFREEAVLGCETTTLGSSFCMGSD